MFYKVGRFLQFLGLILLPIAIAGEVAEKMDLKGSLTLSGVGIAVFLVGWLLQQAGRPQ